MPFHIQEKIKLHIDELCALEPDPLMRSNISEEWDQELMRAGNDLDKLKHCFTSLRTLVKAATAASKKALFSEMICHAKQELDKYKKILTLDEWTAFQKKIDALSIMIPISVMAGKLSTIINEVKQAVYTNQSSQSSLTPRPQRIRLESLNDHEIKPSIASPIGGSSLFDNVKPNLHEEIMRRKERIASVAAMLKENISVLPQDEFVAYRRRIHRFKKHIHRVDPSLDSELMKIATSLRLMKKK